MDKAKIAQALAADKCHAVVNSESVWLEQAADSAVAAVVDDTVIVQGDICAAGSHMLYNFRPPYQAECVSRMQADNYAVVARANVGEFGMGAVSESWFGSTSHPRDEKRVASAAAAAVKEGIAEVGLSLDEGGSALTAAALTGCTAFRPTYGAAPRFGLISYISSTEQLCGVADKLDDAARMMETVCGHDEKDATSLQQEKWDFTSAVELKGKKAALVNLPGAPDYWNKVAAAAAEKLQAAGIGVETVQLPYAELAPLSLRVMSAAEGCNNISRFDGVKYGYRTEKYADIEDLYRKSRTEAMGVNAKFTAILGTFVLSKGRYEQYYYKALQVRGLIKKAFDELFASYEAVLLPGAAGAAPLAEEAAARYEADLALTAAPALAGLPVVSLPWCIGEPLPVCVQVAADSCCDGTALAVARILEGGAC